MTLLDERLREPDHPSTLDERSLLRCRVAADFIQRGQYEAASEALGELWPGVGRAPGVEGLRPAAAAEVLLQCGTLTGWLGSAQSVEGSQEFAKDLLSEALRSFQTLGAHAKASEAQYELGICYWRLGAYDEARVVMAEALRPLTDEDAELKAKIHLRQTLVEISENRYYEALNILKAAEPVFDSLGDAFKGRWHGQKSLIFRRLATAEKREDYFDKAIIECTASIFHYEQARHERYCALNLNNLAFLLYKLGRYAEAHEHLDRARSIFVGLHDNGNLAQVDETRARVLVAERRYREANQTLAGAIETFEKGGDSALLADALTVQGVVLARLASFESSIEALNRAQGIAQGAGALTNAGHAALTLIEEHGATPRLTETELVRAYLGADKFLKGTQDAEDVRRLSECARITIKRLSGRQVQDKNFSFYSAVHEFEARLIERALEACEGSVTKAARLLGLTHQTLGSILSQRHKSLAGKRTPREKRRRSVVKGKKRRKRG